MRPLKYVDVSCLLQTFLSSCFVADSVEQDAISVHPVLARAISTALSSLVVESWYTVTQVAVRPTLAPLTVDAVPENLAPHVSLSSSLTGKNWDAIRKHTFNNANHR